MKRLYFFFLAGVAAITVSCQQEQPITPESPIDENDFEIVGVIHNADETPDSKTAYTLNGADLEHSTSAIFSWAQNDEIQLIVKNENDGSLNKYRLYAKESSATSKFKDNGGYEKDPIGRIVSGEWNHTGFAIYPVSGPDYLSYSKGESVDDIRVTLSDSYTLTSLENQLALVPLIGIRRGETSYYDFHPGTGVLAFTLTNVPTSATSVRLTSLDDGKYLSGQFTLDSDAALKINSHVGSTGAQSRTVTFPSLAEKGSLTLYIPLPIGTLTNGIRIELLDDVNDYPIFKKKYSQSLTIEQGVIKTVSLAAPSDWKKLGTGEFVDNFLFGKIAGADGASYSDKIDIDIPDYVPVVVEQSLADPSQYRLVEPYKTAREQFGYSPRVATTPDKYLYFTISSADGTITYHNGDENPYVTGMVVDAGNKIIKLQKKAGRTTDKLLDGTYDDPKVIQLDPVYKFTDDSNFYHNDKERGNMIHLIFPGAKDDYKPVITLGDNPRTVVSSFNLTTVSPRVHLLLSKNNAVYTGCNWTYNNGGTVQDIYTSNQTGVDWSSYIDSSGPWYLIWHVYTESNIEVLRQGCFKFDALTTTDAANIDLIAGTYLRDIHTGSCSAAAVEKELNLKGGNTLTIEQSNDLSKGIVMISGFAGYNYNLEGSALSTDGLTAGSPLYGSFNGTAATFPYRSLSSADAFYTNGSTAHYISAATKDLDDITLNYSTDRIVTGGRWLADSGGSTVGTYRIYWEDSYTAYRTSGQISLTGGMIKASSTAGDNNTSNLVDKDAATIWHAAYSGTHALNEEYGIYLDIDLGTGNTVTKFTLMFQDRDANVYNYPTKYKIYGYNSSTEVWDVLTGEDPVNAVTGIGTWNQCRISDNETAYQKIRLSITETDDQSGPFSTLVPSAEGNHGTTHLAELQLWRN